MTLKGGRKKFCHRSFSGFTLIELLIVVAIIAILAAIAVPNFLEAQVRSKVSRNKADMRSIATALEAYGVDNNIYPPPWDLTSGIPATRIWGTLVEPGPLGNGGGPFHSRTPGLITTPQAYMTSVPEDPFREKSVAVIASNLRPWERRHIYYNFKYFFDGTPAFLPGPNNFTEANKLGGSWLMYSIGPDGDEFNRPPGVTVIVGQRVYRDYDPTNGTISRGNVFRTQKTNDKLGVVPFFWTTP